MVLGDELTAHWIGVLNDARLAVGTALNVTADWAFEALDPDDPGYELHALYAWMTRAPGRAALGVGRLSRSPGSGAFPGRSSLEAACSSRDRRRRPWCATHARWQPSCFDAVGSAVRGAPDTVRLALVALLSGGHLLVEGMPGHRQDAAGEVDGGRDRRSVRPRAVHP